MAAGFRAVNMPANYATSTPDSPDCLAQLDEDPRDGSYVPSENERNSNKSGKRRARPNASSASSSTRKRSRPDPGTPDPIILGTSTSTEQLSSIRVTSSSKRKGKRPMIIKKCSGTKCGEDSPQRDYFFMNPNDPSGHLGERCVGCVISCSAEVKLKRALLPYSEQRAKKEARETLLKFPREQIEAWWRIVQDHTAEESIRADDYDEMVEWADMMELEIAKTISSPPKNGKTWALRIINRPKAVQTAPSDTNEPCTTLHELLLTEGSEDNQPCPGPRQSRSSGTARVNNPGISSPATVVARVEKAATNTNRESHATSQDARLYPVASVRSPSPDVGQRPGSGATTTSPGQSPPLETSVYNVDEHEDPPNTPQTPCESGTVPGGASTTSARSSACRSVKTDPEEQVLEEGADQRKLTRIAALITAWQSANEQLSPGQMLFLDDQFSLTARFSQVPVTLTMVEELNNFVGFLKRLRQYRNPN